MAWLGCILVETLVLPSSTHLTRWRFSAKESLSFYFWSYRTLVLESLSVLAAVIWNWRSITPCQGKVVSLWLGRVTSQLFQLSEEVWLGRVELRIWRACLPRNWNIHRAIITAWGEWEAQGSLLSCCAWAPPSHNKISQVQAHHPENCLQSTQPLVSWICWASNPEAGGRVGLTAFHWWRTDLSRSG